MKCDECEEEHDGKKLFQFLDGDGYVEKLCLNCYRNACKQQGLVAVAQTGK